MSLQNIRLFFALPALVAPAKEEATFSHIPALDGLRAVSVLIVMMSHFISAKFFPGGLGVLIFFVISGFLITRLLFAEIKYMGKISLKNFYLRRVFRLYPVILFYIISVVFVYIFLAKEIDFIQIFYALFYYANYYYSIIYSYYFEKNIMPFAILWSLAVEEHFYIFFPLLFAFFHRRNSLFLVVVLFLCLFPLVARLLFILPLSREEVEKFHFITYYQTHYRIDSIAYGVLLAFACEQVGGRQLLSSLRSPFILIFSVGLLLVSLLWRDPFFRETIRYTLQALAVMLIIFQVVFLSSNLAIILRRFLEWKPLVWIGKLSYSLYLWHFFTGFVINELKIVLPFFIMVIIKFLSSFILALASYFLVEMPFLSLRRRFGSHQNA